MAEFCKQCSIDMFGKDYGDLAYDRGSKLPPGHGWSVICEGCGFILVDDDGVCISCDKMKGLPGHGERKLTMDDDNNLCHQTTLTTLCMTDAVPASVNVPTQPEKLLR